MHGLSLVAASGGYSLLLCTGFSLRWLLLLWSTDSSGTRFLLAACLGTGFSACTFAGVAKGTAAAKKIRTHQSLLLYSLLPEFPSLMSLPVSG